MSLDLYNIPNSKSLRQGESKININLMTEIHTTVSTGEKVTDLQIAEDVS